MYLKRIFCRNIPKKRLALIACLLLVCTIGVVAQTTGAAGFSAATKEIQSYQEPVKKLMYAIAAVIALVGAGTVYFKMNNGDQDVKKTIVLVIGGCVAMVAMAQALPAFFN